jgi:hypothetical protein
MILVARFALRVNGSVRTVSVDPDTRVLRLKRGVDHDG